MPYFMCLFLCGLYKRKVTLAAIYLDVPPVHLDKLCPRRRRSEHLCNPNRRTAGSGLENTWIPYNKTLNKTLQDY